MGEIDKRNKLMEEPFTYILTKKATIIIYFNNKQIKVVKEIEAERLIKRLKDVENNILEVQLLLAKITGNFKHGNEKVNKKK
ncbi:hypothetical protein GW626_02765 [Peribacillus muralis]|uniref:hypothetical protein n=1 Tax=Peribacillus muralis TaxID=264697 RepID=UPI001F4E60F3|nr:hypothetical protein [Peribacillus muralis]MCK1994003.1 hypothetical protein [Peribacillus muralis]MCK2014558.1 hypothetical protein [Peribacillus muralis]